MRGYFGIGIVGCKTAVNVGTLWRSAHNFGAAFVVIIGARYCPRRQASDTTNARLHLPFYRYATFDEFRQFRPCDCPLVGVEQTPESWSLETFCHPRRAVYLLGAEDTGVPPTILAQCQMTIAIPTPMCLNVAVAGSIVMYDRLAKQHRITPPVLCELGEGT
jgi:tRNA (guanosine-2'-O-)-methyltransferase